MPYETRKRKRDREQKYDDICAVNSNPQSHNHETGNFGKLTTSSATTSKLKKVTNSYGPNDANSINHDQDDDEQVDQSQWNHLPHTILAQIYSHLDPIHQRRASITCKQWRDCYFSPNLWRDVQLCPTGPWWNEDGDTAWKGAEFVLERCGKYIRNLQVFTFTLNMLKQHELWPEIQHDRDGFNTDTRIRKLIPQMTSLLRTIHCNCKSLESLQLKLSDGALVGVFKFYTEDILIDGRSSIAKGMWSQIPGILTKCPSLKRLQLDHLVDVIGFDDRLKRVAKTCGNSLTSLHCSVSFTHTERPPKTYTNSLKMMNQLTDLRLNLRYITDELLQILSSAQHCPMKIIEILIQGVYYYEERIVDSFVLTNNAWTAMMSHSEDLQVGVVCYYDTRSEALAKVLQLSAIPLKWLKIISFTDIEEEVFGFLQNNFTQDLQRLDLLNVHDQVDEFAYHLTPEESDDTNPVVMTMWRCSNLTQLNITGLKVTSNDIVGIARMGVRLGGSSLQTFGVEESSIVYEEPVDTRGELVAEVRKCLTQDWEPLDGVGARMIKWDALDKVSANNWGSGPVSTG